MWIQYPEETNNEINYDAVTIEDCDIMAGLGRYAVINDGKLEGFKEEK